MKLQSVIMLLALIQMELCFSQTTTLITADLKKYLEGLESQGWIVNAEQNPVTSGVEVEAQKLIEDAEKHGIFGVPWDNKDTLKFKYVPDTDTTYKLYDFEGYKEEKAPIFGQWERVDNYKTLPQGFDAPPSTVTGDIGAIIK